MSHWIALIARLVVGGVWLVAGAIKLPDPAASVQAVRAYQLLPPSIAEVLGYLLPILEVVVGLCLIAGVLTRANAALSSVLLVLFIGGIASVWARGLEINCGCFGDGGVEPGASDQYPWEIARDLGLLALSAFLVWRPRSRFSADRLLFADATDWTSDRTTKDEHV